VGIDEELIPLLRRIADEAELYAIANYLPDAQSDAVLLLADGKTTDEVWAELAKDYELTPGAVDTEDIDAALGKPGTRSSFVVTTSDAELVELLSGDFEAWRTFLHPTQRAVAYRPVFNGPAKITGGAGTGKTVVAVHRATIPRRSSSSTPVTPPAASSSPPTPTASPTTSTARCAASAPQISTAAPDLHGRLLRPPDARCRQGQAPPRPSRHAREIADQAAAMSASTSSGSTAAS
jgi:hypothetical protein